MKPKLLIALILMVVIPLGVLTWGGLHMARQERERVERQFRVSLNARLGEINAAIARRVEQNAQELRRATEVNSFSDETLRAVVRSNRLIRQLFVLNSDGSLLYPDVNNPELTEREQEFLGRTRSLWADGETFYHPADVQKMGTRSMGWYTWFRDQGVQLIFWQHLSSGHVVGADVERTAMMADVIAALPASQPTVMRSRGSYSEYVVPERLVLSEIDGESIYEWGAYDPVEGETPMARIPVIAPFSSWHLSVFMSPTVALGGVGRSAVFNILSALLAVLVSLILLALYFYRESVRDFREAAQRVSFVNQVSHELRTPLTNIRLYAEMLDAGLSDGNERVRRQVQVVVSESRRLSRLISNVLTYARGQRNGLKLRPSSGVFDACVTSVLDTFRPLLEARGIEIEFVPGAGGCCLFDADAVEQIVGNLLSNVEKYAADGKWLRLETVQTAELIRLEVADRGPGIPRGLRRRIFEPFFRISDRVNEGASGTGIGLGIARALARLHGGDLDWIPSETGASFRVTLTAPLAAAVS